MALHEATLPRELKIEPPLLNSANPWATTYEDLFTLYKCAHTGAVTTRTSLLNGFPHDDKLHKYAFFDPSTHITNKTAGEVRATPEQTSSLNNLGYSPLVLNEYLGYIERISKIAEEDELLRKDKPFIISVTGTPSEITECLARIRAVADKVSMLLAMEINLSCPNIPGKPPPAYDASSLSPYLTALLETNDAVVVPVGLKLPPYTYADQFSTLCSTLAGSIPCPIVFLTSTNTLGNSMLLAPSIISNLDASPLWLPVLAPTLSTADQSSAALPTGLGGLAGSALHPLALGNVFSLRRHLRTLPGLDTIKIIGVGGVEDAEGYKRMRHAGAMAVGVGTGLGRWGMGVFERIAEAWADGEESDKRNS